MSEYDESFLVCDDCGRQFPRSELRRCKICGHYVCPECRGTHVAKYHKPAAKQEQPSYVPPVAAANQEQGGYHVPQQEPVSSKPVNHLSQEQPRVVPPVYHAAAPASEEVVACVDCGREFPVSRMKKCNICNGAVCSYCQPSHLSKKHGHFLYSDFVTPSTAAPAAAAPAMAFATSPVTEEPDTSIHFKEELEENPIGQASADYSYNTPVAEEPIDTSNIIADDDPGDGRIKCDDCGQYFQKEELRTCRKCGHHVCPSCRSHHKCPKPAKAEKPPKEPKEPKEPKPPKQHKRRKHDELGDPVY